jgi:hypothetical protein
VYCCPREEEPLFIAGSTWLGRDASRGVTVPQPAFEGIEELTAEAAGYGFHATLKPPMRLADGCSWDCLLTATRELAARIAPFALPSLAVTDLHGFLALCETTFCPPLQALADACVERLDGFRAPPSEAELARRRRAQLTDAQEAMLVRFGYPYVLNTWFFHMTLTRRLSAEEHATWRPAVERYFGAAVETSRTVTDICLFTQASPEEPFVIGERIALTG